MLHASVPHVHHAHVHSHVGMGQDRRGIHLRHLGPQRRIGGQIAERIAGPINRLGEYRIGAIVLRLDDDVVGLRDADAEFIDADRLYILAVGRDHGHLQARNTDIEECHRRAVDEAQAYLLAAFEQPHPAVRRRMTVHQEGIGVAGDIRDIAVAHAHVVPHAAPVPHRFDAAFPDLGEQFADGAFAKVIVVAELLQLMVDGVRVLVAPVRQHHHVLAVIAEGFRLDRIDDDRPIGAGLLLKTGVAVIPVGAALRDIELIVVGFTRLDAVKTVADARHAIHLARQDDAMPVDGTVLGEVVGDVQGHSIAFLPAQQRRWHHAVDRRGNTLLAGEVDHRGIDRKLELRAAQFHRPVGCLAFGEHLAAQAETRQRATGRDAGDESSAPGIEIRRHWKNLV